MFLLYLTDETVLNIASSFARAVTQYEEPLSAKRYIIDRNSLSDNLSGGALSHEEFIAYYARRYPSFVNNKYGVNTVVAATLLSVNAAYPKPEDFSGAQIIELKYSADFSVFALYTETENETVQCEVFPILGKIEENDSFPEFASLDNMGATFTYSEYSCDTTVTCSLSDCKLRTGNGLSSDEQIISAAQDLMQSVGKKANLAFLRMILTQEDVIARCLSCNAYDDLTPSHAIVFSDNDLFEICGLDVETVQNRSLLETKLAQDLSSRICNALADSVTVASQSVMNVSTSFLMNKDIDPVIVCLLYENEGNYFAGMVSICPGGNGCAIVNASPLWNLTIVYDLVGFYDAGNAITAYSESLNAWLMSGKYIKIN